MPIWFPGKSKDREVHFGVLKNSYYLSHRTDGLRAWNTSEHAVTFRGSTGKEKRPERDIQETASNKGLDQKVTQKEKLHNDNGAMGQNQVDTTLNVS